MLRGCLFHFFWKPYIYIRLHLRFFFGALPRTPSLFTAWCFPLFFAALFYDTSSHFHWCASVSYYAIEFMFATITRYSALFTEEGPRSRFWLFVVAWTLQKEAITVNISLIILLTRMINCSHASLQPQSQTLWLLYTFFKAVLFLYNISHTLVFFYQVLLYIKPQNVCIVKLCNYFIALYAI